MAPFPPPRGMSTMAHFHVIQEESAITSRSIYSTPPSGSKYLMPPLYGPRSLLCWLLKPVKILILPSSIFTGILTRKTLFGMARYSRNPSSVMPSTSHASLTCFVAFAKGSAFATVLVIRVNILSLVQMHPAIQLGVIPSHK